ncbi:MAG TPA: hypothetical protein VEZ72_02925 [Paenibacillus sp.]|nr:hypothetical protein [Paenibacillus sp.]
MDKWAAAIDLLGSTNGANAKQLSAAIGVSHKTAWTMLKKFRNAIHRLEAERKLSGTVHAGLRALAPKSIFTFLPHRHYRCERVVGVVASVDAYDAPRELAIHVVPSGSLRLGWKELTNEGKEQLSSNAASSGSTVVWLNDFRMDHSPLDECFREANAWLLRLFHGIGSAYLQSYLAEFCFRWNAAARGDDLREAWYKLCYHRPSRKSIGDHLEMRAAA